MNVAKVFAKLSERFNAKTKETLEKNLPVGTILTYLRATDLKGENPEKKVYDQYEIVGYEETASGNFLMRLADRDFDKHAPTNELLSAIVKTHKARQQKHNVTFEIEIRTDIPKMKKVYDAESPENRLGFYGYPYKWVEEDTSA